MKKGILLHVILIGLSFFIISCGKSKELDLASYPIGNYVEDHSEDYESDFSSAYPSYRIETSTTDSISQADDTPTISPTEIVIPSPKTDSAIIYGTLISNKTNQPLSNIQLLLANMIPVNPGPGYIVSTNENSPEVYTNDKGEFLFVDINPNDYVLILKTPFNSYPIVDNNDAQIEINAVSGSIIELGTTYVYWP